MQLHQFELHPLLVGQGSAEHLAALRPFNRLLNAFVQGDERAGCGPQALFLELLHLVDKALAFLANQVALGHAHLVKINQTSVAAVHADLLDFLRHLNAFGERAATTVAHGHHHQAFVFVRRAVAGVDQHAHPVGLQAVGDPHFLAADHVVVAVFAGAAFDGGYIAAGRWF